MLSSGNGWGFQSNQFQAVAVVAGVNAVIANIGVARSIVAGGPIRLVKLGYRIDLAPDVPAGSAASPIYWRVLVVSGTLPSDLTAFQLQAFPAGAHPEIPTNIAGTAPLPVLFDLWLDLSNGDPGLNELAEIEFADSGPSVAAGETLNVLVIPILDSTIAALGPIGASNVIVTVEAFGTGVTVNPQGSAGGYDGQNGARSLPRYDVYAQG
jgi:hypothetical protein